MAKDSKEFKGQDALTAKYSSSVSELSAIDFGKSNNSNVRRAHARPSARAPAAPSAPPVSKSLSAPGTFHAPALSNLPAPPAPSAPPTLAPFAPPPSSSAPPASDRHAQSSIPGYSHCSQSYAATQSSYTASAAHLSQAHSSATPAYPRPGAFGAPYASPQPTAAYPAATDPSASARPPVARNAPPPHLQGYRILSEEYAPNNAPGKENYQKPPPPQAHPRHGAAQSSPQLPPHAPAGVYGAPPSAAAPIRAAHGVVPPPLALAHPQALPQDGASYSSPQLPLHVPPGAYGAPPSASAPNLAVHAVVHFQPGPAAMQLAPAGFFKDLLGRIEALPATRVVGVDAAAARVAELKHKLNELQKKRASYHARQAGNAGVAAASALFTAGSSLLVQGAGAVHQRNRLQQILRAMREVIVQINQIRAEFGAMPGWDEKEGVAKISEKVFSKGLQRGELQGAL